MSENKGTEKAPVPTYFHHILHIRFFSLHLHHTFVLVTRSVPCDKQPILGPADINLFTHNLDLYVPNVCDELFFPIYLTLSD